MKREDIPTVWYLYHKSIYIHFIILKYVKQKLVQLKKIEKFIVIIGILTHISQ